ncbi:MAG: hypothetical protein EOR47_22870 [Mesorhizobium sp.]|nr:MAG: hypothetical protein EOR47_22870 [Mesorhizobium sp.]
MRVIAFGTQRGNGHTLRRSRYIRPRRRRWSAAEKLRIVAESMAPDARVGELRRSSQSAASGGAPKAPGIWRAARMAWSGLCRSRLAATTMPWCFGPRTADRGGATQRGWSAVAAGCIWWVRARPRAITEDSPLFLSLAGGFIAKRRINKVGNASSAVRCKSLNFI